MKKLVAICLALILFGVADVGAEAITQGGLSGTLVSAGAPDASLGVVLYTTPSKGHFVLTQAVAGTVTIAGFGDFLGSHTFSPGLVIPPKTDISCFSDAGTACYIIGVLEK